MITLVGLLFKPCVFSSRSLSRLSRSSAVWDMPCAAPKVGKRRADAQISQRIILCIGLLPSIRLDLSPANVRGSPRRLAIQTKRLSKRRQAALATVEAHTNIVLQQELFRVLRYGTPGKHTGFL